MSNSNNAPLTQRERWLHAATLLVMAIFTGLGVYVLYYPSDLLIAVFGTLMVVTLVMGVVVGIVAVYKS